MKRNLVRVAMGIVAFGAAPLGAQTLVPVSRTLIPDAPTCAQCAVTMTPVVTLQASAALPIPARPLAVTVDGLGRYWLTFPGGRPFAMVFGPDGTVIRQLGPEGTGADSYGSAAPVVALPGDSVLVYDGRQRSHKVLSSDLTIRRSIEEGEHAFGLAVLDWPRLGVSKRGESVTVEGGQPVYERHPIQTISFDGPFSSIVRSMGAGASDGLLPVGTSSFWSWDYNPYRLQYWSADGLLLADLERKPTWFPEGDHPPRGGVGDLPPAHLQGVQRDSAGRLWVFIDEPKTPLRAGYSAGSFLEMYYRTRIEVIDAAAGRIHATTTVPDFILSPLPGMRAAVYETDAAGKPVVRIVQLVLSGGDHNR